MTNKFTRSKKERQHHGIPAVPLIKRSADAELSRPIVFIDSVDIPFGNPEHFEVFRKKRKDDEHSTRFWKNVVTFFLVLTLSVAGWYITTKVHLYKLSQLDYSRDSLDNILGDTYSHDVNESNH